MTQEQDRFYIVAYGYSQQFKLTTQQAKDLIKATEKGSKIVRFDDLVLSTNYSWIAPQELTNVKELDSSELGFCEELAEWLSRDANELGWSLKSALDYSKKLYNRIGKDEVYRLWNDYALGSYPNVKRFLMEAKQSYSLDETGENIFLIESNI